MHARVGLLKLMQVLAGKGAMKGVELHGVPRAGTCAGNNQ